MKQSWLMAHAEALTNIAVGLGLSLAVNAAYLHWRGYPISTQDNVGLGLLMTVLSYGRQLGLRRFFERIGVRVKLSAFLFAVAATRREHEDKLGWTPEHDDAHPVGELAWHGALYVTNALARARRRSLGLSHDDSAPPKGWRWPAEDWHPEGFRRDLVKGAALMAAEGDKHDRRKKSRGGEA